MSKIFKMGILLSICMFGLLFLVPNNVEALSIESLDTLEEAFEGKAATIEGSTITLTGDVEFINPDWTEGSEDSKYDVVELSGGDYVLNLNGQTLTAYEIFINDGSLTINDSYWSGTVRNMSEYSGITIYNGAELKVNNGIIDSVIINQGDLTINDGDFRKFIHNYFDYDYERNVLNGLGNLYIKKGTFSGILQEGNATIEGGVFRDYANFTPLTISVYEENQDAITIIKGGEFKSSNPEIYGAIEIFNSLVSLANDEIEKYIPGGYVVDYDDATIITESAAPYVSYKNTVKVYSQEILNLLEEIAPNGVWTVNSYKPTNPMEGQSLLTALLKEAVGSNVEEVYAWYDERPEVGTMQLGESGSGNDITKEVRIVYNEPSTNSNKVVNEFLTKMKKLNLNDIDEKTAYRVEDLYLINYLYNAKNGIDGSMALNFSKELIEAANGSNIYFRFYGGFGGGDSEGLYTYEGGQAAVFYQKTAYATINAGVNLNHVLYIPKDTANTTDAYIKAAMKRIEDYLGTTKRIKIEVGNSFESLNYYDEYAERVITWNENEFIDEETSGSNYYNVTINGRTYKFAICKKDVDELKNPEYLASDIISNIVIKSNSSELPLDTAISVKNVNDDNIEKILGTNTYAAYDISLYSNAKEVNITKLKNGKFVVSIPVPEILKDKEITVYYINSKGEKEEHVASVKDGIASFETDHFSTYILTEKNLEKNPETFDGIKTNILIGIISFIGLLITTLYLRKQTNRV